MSSIKNGWILNPYGNKRHYINDKLHCDDGPAVIFRSGTKYWFKENLRHREDGPAVESVAGYCSWWYEGKCLGVSCEGYTQEEFQIWKRFKVFL